jgi:hypothetical protein
MEIEIRITASEDEMEEVTNALSELNAGVSTDRDALELSPTEIVVLRAVRENPGRALRTVHRNAASYDDSPIDWTEEWSNERTTVQSALRTLRSQNLVYLDQRSWYPEQEDEE